MRLFEAGDVFRGPFPLGNSLKDRPVIIVVDEDATDGTLIACTTTDDSIFVDSTTELKARCHPLINKDCTVAYGEAKVLAREQADQIRRLISAGQYQFNPQHKIGIADLKRIQQGFGDSNGVPLDERDLPVSAHKYAKKRGII